MITSSGLLEYIFYLSLINTLLLIYFLVRYSRTRRKIYDKFTLLEKKIMPYMKILDDKNYRLWKAKVKAEKELMTIKKPKKR
jgi:hypothetical protein